MPCAMLRVGPCEIGTRIAEQTLRKRGLQLAKAGRDSEAISLCKHRARKENKKSGHKSIEKKQSKQK